MALQPPSPSLEFEVRMNPWELVTPADPTPHELKLLSDLDDPIFMRFNVPSVFLYRHDPSSPMAGKDPVEVIRQALAKALVFYYPFAGRLKEAPGGKLMVDCNGEGVIFIGADADVTFDQLGNDPQPPFPFFDKLLYNVNVPGSDGTINCPLLLIQVTRLKCGGFFLALRSNHCMSDANGITLFLKGLAEIACGASKPSILPVWCRELLCARDPPRVTCTHHQFQKLPIENKSTITPHYRSFFFGPTEIDAIRDLLPNHFTHQSTTIEVLAAFLWRYRTIALQWENPNQEVYFFLNVSARYGICRFNPPIPDGFYGNAFVFPRVIATVGELCTRPLEYALELVKKAKNEANEEYVHSVADLMSIKEKPYLSFGLESLEAFLVSDVTKVGLNEVNFGWGNPVYGGISMTNLTTNLIIPYTNSKGEKGRLVLVCLPSEAIERFAKELDKIFKTD